MSYAPPDPRQPWRKRYSSWTTRPAGLAALREILTQHQLLVLEAMSDRQALEVHRRERVHLIVMDLQMPGMDGEQVTRAIRNEAELKDVSILLFADSARPGLKERSFSCGANDFIPKPFNNSELLARVWPLVNVAVRKRTALLAHVDIEKDGRAVESLRAS